MKSIPVGTGQKFTILSTTNNITTTSHKRLSVQISLTGLSFFVTDANENSLLWSLDKSFDTAPSPEEILAMVVRCFEEESSLQDEFDSVALLYATSLYTVIPRALFDKNKASEYLKFNAKILPNDYIAIDELPVHDSVIVYVPYVNINNFFFDRFGSFSYYHVVTLLMSHYVPEERHSETQKAIVRLLPTTFDLLIFDEGKLVLCNTYTYHSPEDFLYYLLFAFEQLQLNPESIAVELIGAKEHSDERYDLAYQYVRHIDKHTLPVYQLVNATS